MESWYNPFLVAGSQAMASVGVYLPRIIASLLIIIIGSALAKVIRNVLVKIFETIRVSTALKDTPIEHFLKNADLTHKIEDVVGSVFYWIMMLVVIHSAVSVLGLASLTLILEKVLAYLPQVISSILILFIGLLVSGVVESLVKGSIKTIDGKSARLFGKIASYLVMVLTIMIAISELGIAQEFILVLFIGVVTFAVLAFGLSFGLGGQHVMKEILQSWYTSFKKQTKE